MDFISTNIWKKICTTFISLCLSNPYLCEAYLGPYEVSKMELFVKEATKSRQLFYQKASSLMCDGS